ncbi:MAG: DUF1858 domain-containing protein [Clostridia bacterium]|nr:DUF1858 domain-containing protein [Clostridia bacterium]
MEFNEKTKLAEIIKTYPWLPETVAKKDERLQVINSPIVKALIRHATLEDAGRLSGYPVDEIIHEMQKIIDEHEGRA